MDNKITRKIVAIGGGENGRVGSGGEKKPYETFEIDQEIVKLSGKDKPHFLLLAHSQIPWGEEREIRYFDTMKKIYGEKFGCECRLLKISELRADFSKAIADVEWADIIYEGGGATYDMINLWRETGFDEILKQAWENGKVMCGISAGAIAWFSMGNTADPQFINDEYNKVEGLGLVDAYLIPHCQVEHRYESAKRSLKYANKVGIHLSNCVAVEIIDDSYRIIISTPYDPNFKPYTLKTYWYKSEYIDEKLQATKQFQPLTELVNKQEHV